MASKGLGVLGLWCFTAAAISQGVHAQATTTAPPAPPPAERPFREGTVPARNISIAISAFKAANLTGSYNTTPATIFAPSNRAFSMLAAKLNLSAPEDLANPMYANISLPILLNHIVRGKPLYTDELSVTPINVTTAAGPDYQLEVWTQENGTVFIVPVGPNGTSTIKAQVVIPDIAFASGAQSDMTLETVVHIINRVLVPAT